jgi:hypothetical protein
MRKKLHDLLNEVPKDTLDRMGIEKVEMDTQAAKDPGFVTIPDPNIFLNMSSLIRDYLCKYGKTRSLRRKIAEESMRHVSLSLFNHVVAGFSSWPKRPSSTAINIPGLKVPKEVAEKILFLGVP